MPAAARQSERRPSAPIDQRRAERYAAPERDRDARRRRRRRLRSSSISAASAAPRARCSSAATRRRFSILWPKASSPISSASNFTSGARQAGRCRRRCACVRSGAACSRTASQTPSARSAVTEPASKAVVRLSGRRRARRPTRSRCRPAASATAAVRPPGRRRPQWPFAFLSGIKSPVPALVRLARRRSGIMRATEKKKASAMRYAWTMTEPPSTISAISAGRRPARRGLCAAASWSRCLHYCADGARLALSRRW